jgi:O-antigen/teichoic acid export membrane protein
MPLLVAWLHGPQLAGLLFAALAARTLGLMALAFTCWRNLTRGQPVRVERSRMVALLKFGGWITVSAFVGPFMVILDRFVIGALLGAVAVTIYTVPFQLAQRAMFIPESLTTAVFPRLTACSGNEQISLCQAGVRSIAAVMTLFMVLGIMLIEPFLKLWIGGDFHHESAQVGRIILLGFWTNALAFVPFSFLQARGRPNIGAAVHIIELPFYFAVFYVLMQNLGTTGAAMAFSLRCAVDMVIFNHLALRSNALWAMIASISCLPIAAIGAAEFLPPLSIEWSAATALLSLAAAAVAWRIAPPQLQALVQKNLVRLRPVRTNAV